MGALLAIGAAGTAVIGSVVIGSVATLTNEAIEVRKCVTNNADQVTNGTLESLATITRSLDTSLTSVTNNVDKLTNGMLGSLAVGIQRLNVSVALITDAVLGLAAAIALSLLLYLTQFSPLLRATVWMMFGSLCFSMVLTYLRQSRCFIGEETFAHHPYQYCYT